MISTVTLCDKNYRILIELKNVKTTNGNTHGKHKRKQKQQSRRFFKLSVLFFQDQPFTIFQEGLSVRRTDIFFYLHSSNRPHYLIEQIQFSKKPLFRLRTHTNFPGASIFSSNRYQFSRSLIFSSNTYYFPGDPYALNRYFVNRSRWLLSCKTILLKGWHVSYSYFEVQLVIFLQYSPLIK